MKTAGIAFIVLVALVTLPQDTSASQRSTGEVVALAAPGVTVDVRFNAHGPGQVKGKVNYTNSLGEFFNGDVSICYVQVGSTAVFAGTMDESAGTFAGPFFRIEVYDNGEGQASAPDLISVTSFASAPACVFTGLFLNPVIEGNLSVHRP